jgi:hypothetical protein
MGRELGTDLGGRYGEWIDVEVAGVKDGVEIRARARMESKIKTLALW